MVTHPWTKNLNVTIVDEKLNFCDFCVEALKLYCPLQPGTYYMNDTNYVPSIFWTVSKSLLAVFGIIVNDVGSIHC